MDLEYENLPEIGNTNTAPYRDEEGRFSLVSDEDRRANLFIKHMLISIDHPKNDETKEDYRPTKEFVDDMLVENYEDKDKLTTVDKKSIHPQVVGLIAKTAAFHRELLSNSGDEDWINFFITHYTNFDVDSIVTEKCIIDQVKARTDIQVKARTDIDDIIKMAQIGIGNIHNNVHQRKLFNEIFKKFTLLPQRIQEFYSNIFEIYILVDCLNNKEDKIKFEDLKGVTELNLRNQSHMLKVKDLNEDSLKFVRVNLKHTYDDDVGKIKTEFEKMLPRTDIYEIDGPHNLLKEEYSKVLNDGYKERTGNDEKTFEYKNLTNAYNKYVNNNQEFNLDTDRETRRKINKLLMNKNQFDIDFESQTVPEQNKESMGRGIYRDQRGHFFMMTVDGSRPQKIRQNKNKCYAMGIEINNGNCADVIQKCLKNNDETGIDACMKYLYDDRNNDNLARPGDNVEDVIKRIYPSYALRILQKFGFTMREVYDKKAGKKLLKVESVDNWHKRVEAGDIDIMVEDGTIKKSFDDVRNPSEDNKQKRDRLVDFFGLLAKYVNANPGILNNNYAGPSEESNQPLRKPSQLNKNRMYQDRAVSLSPDDVHMTSHDTSRMAHDASVSGKIVLNSLYRMRGNRLSIPMMLRSLGAIPRRILRGNGVVVLGNIPVLFGGGDDNVRVTYDPESRFAPSPDEQKDMHNESITKIANRLNNLLRDLESKNIRLRYDQQKRIEELIKSLNQNSIDAEKNIQMLIKIAQCSDIYFRSYDVKSDKHVDGIDTEGLLDETCKRCEKIFEELEKIYQVKGKLHDNIAKHLSY